MYDLSEKSLNDCLEVFIREIQKMHNEMRTEPDDKLQKDIQRKITILNAILTSLSKLKTYYKKI